jgi:uncharacterized zinc-type alcohol dehydrogenase-like protein
MKTVKAIGATSAEALLDTLDIERREPAVGDVEIEILYCGVCHSDIHTARGEWPGTIYPVVPGHEIVGKVTRVGEAVRKFKVGQTVGVGCFVDSCQSCHNCQEGLEQYCEAGVTATYNSPSRVDKTITKGGYSTHIVVREEFVLHVSDKLPLHAVAPLLCAGITTYSPLRHWKVGKGHRLAVLGLGGLGHMAVKLGASMGAEVTVLSRSENKRADAQKLGAHQFELTTHPKAKENLSSRFDFIIDTVSASHDYSEYLPMLKTNGVMIVLGVPPTPSELHATQLIFGRKTLAGSLVGGIKETQEMLDYCAAHGIVSDVEMIQADEINQAYERTIAGDVKYRFVIDMASLKA